MIAILIYDFGRIGRMHVTIFNGYLDCEVIVTIDINPASKDHDLYPKVAHFFGSIVIFLGDKVE